MATLKDRSHPAISGPKRARFSEIQTPRSPPTNRRHTFAGIKSHSEPTPSKYGQVFGRIEKTSPRRKTTRLDNSIADQFADRLDDHRVQIQTDVDKQLGEIHAEHINQVESLSTQFEEQLSILHRAEEPLHSPLAAEMIRIETVKAGGEHDHKYIDVKLEERVVEFQKLVKEKHLAISKLIDEWNETQVEIIALAAEILGPEKVAIKKDKKHKEHFDFDVVFKQSKITHDRSEKDFEGVLNEISGLEQKATELTETTKQTMRKQQQERALIQQRHLKEISRLAKEIEYEED